jgi:2'-5' RNA ligase
VLRRPSQQAAFALLQAQERRGLPHGAATLQLGVPSLTCVVRLPSAVALPIHQAVRSLPGVERHYVYPASDLHLTLLNLGASEDLEAVAAVLIRTAPFAVRLRGLQLSRHSVSVRAFDDTGALQAVRRRLIEVTGTRPAWPRRRLGFVNVVRYLSQDVQQLTEAVRDQRARPFGVLEVTVAEVVRTDKVLSADGTTLLARWPLAGAADPAD